MWGALHGAPVFVCRWRVVVGGGPCPSLCLQVEVVVGDLGTTHSAVGER